LEPQDTAPVVAFKFLIVGFRALDEFLSKLAELKPNMNALRKYFRLKDPSFKERFNTLIADIKEYARRLISDSIALIDVAEACLRGAISNDEWTREFSTSGFLSTDPESHSKRASQLTTRVSEVMATLEEYEGLTAGTIEQMKVAFESSDKAFLCIGIVVGVFASIAVLPVAAGAGVVISYCATGAAVGGAIGAVIDVARAMPDAQKVVGGLAQMIAILETIKKGADEAPKQGERKPLANLPSLQILGETLRKSGEQLYTRASDTPLF
jgi:hypothetical protein